MSIIIGKTRCRDDTMLENTKKNEAQEIFSEVIVNNKYAKFKPEELRRETWLEICNRNKEMHLKHISELPILRKVKNAMSRTIKVAYDDYIIPRKILPSMRSKQFGVYPIFLAPNRIYNCAYQAIDDIAAFSETMFLLLGGTGVGYSVQYHHVAQLPSIKKPNPRRTYRHLIGDSIEGWAEAVRVLFESYTGKRSTTPRFDYSDIRPKGALLKTSGGRAPGPTPLRNCLTIIEGMLFDMPDHHKMKPIEVHDILCHIADAVLAGGIRRAAMISLFSADDKEMIAAKSPQQLETNPQRHRANNSAVLLRHRVTKQFFDDLWSQLKYNKSGEPGFYFSNDKDWGTNPCAEISLRNHQFCNLVEVNVGDVESQADLNARVEMAAFIGTIQASYTDFHYLREDWKKTTEKDALLGVSMTGIANKNVLSLDLKEAAQLVQHENERVAGMLGINSAARLTCVKPAGTTSCVLGTSSGIHAWHSEYYIRTVRLLKNEPLAEYLTEKLPELVEDDLFNTEQVIFSIPQKIPHDNVITREESAMELLERIKKFSLEWVKPGHVSGMNDHNVSATVYIRDHEWDVCREWFWENRYNYNGLSVLPFDGGVYKQAPFQECDEVKYNKFMGYLREIDLTEIVEMEDNTNLQGELACAGGVCEI